MARRKQSGALEDWAGLISKLPWWAGVAIALAAYLALHAWTASLAQEMKTRPAAGIFYMLVMLGQYIVPLVCALGAIASALNRGRRKTLADNVAAARSADALESMSWREFEMLIGEGFRRKGFKVEELGGAGPDGGVDLVLRKDGEKHLVQCKQWRAFKVGVQVVRELYGVMAATGAAGGFVVTSGRFTDEAVAFADGRNIELLDGAAAMKLMQSARTSPAARAEPPPEPAASTRTSKESGAPMCPKCAGPMVMRTARKGANAGGNFWGCSAFPKCRGIA